MKIGSPIPMDSIPSAGVLKISSDARVIKKALRLVGGMALPVKFSSDVEAERFRARMNGGKGYLKGLRVRKRRSTVFVYRTSEMDRKATGG